MDSIVMGGSSLRGLVKARDCRSKRISSWDQTGKNRDCIAIPAQSAQTIAEIKGAGCINHIWITIGCEDKLYPRKTLLRMYWDGEKNPSVESPIGDFFGVGHGRLNHFVSLPLNMITSQGSPQSNAAMNCFFPMPFANGARIEVVNECDVQIRSFYYYVDYEVHDSMPDDTLRFHAHWRREFPTQGMDYARVYKAGKSPDDFPNIGGKENYVILDAQGRGHYVGVVLNIDHINPSPKFSWFGEGDDMIFIDGDTWPPSLHGTGTEDYFCAAWGFPAGKYDGPYHGISLAGPNSGLADYSGKWSVYRFHIEDPVCFRERIKVTIEHGHANCHSDDYSSVAYWYQTEPHKKFPKMLPASKRLPMDDRESLMLNLKSRMGK